MAGSGVPDPVSPAQPGTDACQGAWLAAGRCRARSTARIRLQAASAGRLGEPGVQPIRDLLRGVGATLPFGPGKHHPGGGDTREASQSDYFPPAHLPMLRRCLR